MPTSAWMVRAGNDNELAGKLFDRGTTAIGWAALGDLTSKTSRKQVKSRYADAYPDDSKHRKGVNAGQVYRFAHVMSEGDLVVTYLKASRTYRVGRVTGSYAHRPDLFEHYPHTRPVDWLGTIDRDDLSVTARNSLGSTLTVFSVDNYASEFLVLLEGEPLPVEDEEAEEEEPPFFDEVKAQADELIADLVARLDPYELEDLVAAVLRSMGFQAKTTTPGPDGGVDVIAHPDAFGFEKPRIIVQVKHVSSPIGSADMRSFIGTLHTGESGLYVSTAGFTSSAETEAKHAHESICLLDRDAFIDLMLQHYEALEPEYKAQIPLRRVWLPTDA